MALAGRAGLDVVQAGAKADGRPYLLIKRYDREMRDVRRSEVATDTAL